MSTTQVPNESLLQGIADSVGSLIYASDLEGRCIFANRKVEELFGVSAGGLLGRTREGFLPVEVWRQHRANDLAVIRSGRQQTTEETNTEADGIHTYLSVKSPLRDADGQMVGVVGVSADITERKRVEEALRRSQEQVRLIFDLAGEGIFLADSTGRWLEVNDRGAEMLGYARDELLTMGMKDVVAPDDLAARPIEWGIARSGEAILSERRFVRKDGSELPVEISAQMLPDGRILGLVRDTSERKHAEEELHHAERLNARILQTTPSLVYVYDLLETRNVYANREVSEYLGYTPEQIQAFGPALFDNVLHPDDAEAVARHHARFAQADDEDVFEVEYRMKHSSGEWRWLRSRDVAFVRDREGRTAQILGFTEDITERKRSEDALLRQEELYRVTFDNAAVGIAHVAPDGRWIRVNRRLCDILGYPAEELTRLTFADITHPDDVERTAGALQPFLEGQEDVYRTEKRYMRKDGSIVWVDVSVAAIRDEQGCVDYQVTVIEDITERKESHRVLAESQERLNLALDSAGMGVWHWDISEDRRYFDEQVCALLGLDFEAFAGTPEEFFSVLHPDDAGPLRLRLARTLETDAPYEPEYRAVWNDGSIHWVAARGRLVRDDSGKPVRINGIIWDISEHKEGESQRSRALAAITETVGRVTEQRDPYTAGHQRRVSQLAAAIATRLGMADRDIEEIQMAGLIHDVGKVAVPAEILSKPGALSPVEFELIKAHAEAGYEVIVGANMEGLVAEIVHQHHERCDGSGYPRGLLADELLPGSKVMMVADVVEAMVSHRPYRAALGVDAALAEIAAGSGSRYDADVAKACVGLFAGDGFEFSD